MAHKNYEQLLRLVSYFNVSDDFVCIVHPDKKWKLNPACLAELKKTCVVVENRKSAYLTEWSMIEVTLELIYTAKAYEKEHNIKFSYFQLISGQDYPLRSIEEYNEYLDTHYPESFIDYTNEKVFARRMFSRWRYHLPRKIVCPISRGNLLVRKVLLLPTAVFEIIYSKCFHTPKEYFEKHEYKYAAGPAWWVLTDEALSGMLKTIETDNKLINHLKNIGTPEENFFQTIYVNGGYPNSNRCLTHSHFRKAGYQDASHPYIITEDEVHTVLEKLRENDVFFARKFDITVDRNVLDKIDELWLNNRGA